MLRTRLSPLSQHVCSYFSEPSSNVLWYTSDVTQLPHYTPEDPDFLWNDIQFSKRSSTKQTLDFDIGGQGKIKCIYYKAECIGVKKCSECEYALPNAAIKNTCINHPTSPLIRVTNCDVEFVYIRPIDSGNNQRWLGGLLRKHNFRKICNFHNHNVITRHRIPTNVRKDIAHAVKSNPTLTTSELSCGKGLGYCPAAADLSAAHKGRLNTIRRHVLEKSDKPSCGYLSLLEMEKIADQVDNNDKQKEGSDKVSTEYGKLCRPYMRKYAITADLIYQLIMAPLMSRILCSSEYIIEVDTTYNENTDLPYLFNVTAFDYKVMRWMAVAESGQIKKIHSFIVQHSEKFFSNARKTTKTLTSLI